jgi:hypothetical protein
MLNVWTQQSGYKFVYTYEENGVIKTTTEFPERIGVSVPLPVNPSDLTDVNFSVISGRLPGGLRLTFESLLDEWVIKGSPFEVARTTTFTFVLRAQRGADISDRTYSITVEGADAPRWITPGKDPELVIRDYNEFETFLPGNVIRFNNKEYIVTKPALGITPPNIEYYRTFFEPTGQLAVGPYTVRTTDIAQISRINNRCTIITQRPHNFLYGNRVSIICSDPTFNRENAELLQPFILPNETEEQYNERLRYEIVYQRAGANKSLSAASGSVTLTNEPLTFVLDNSLVDFQLQAVDNDLSAGQELEFFIADGDGQLPPGLTLDKFGRIYGIVDPILALDLTAREGFYDSNLFDNYPYDFGSRPNISNEGFVGVLTPRKLNRNYEFVVSVSDGETIARRRFRIFVVGDDFLRTDNSVIQIGNSAFTGDATYLRAPIWLSAANLGLKRANNYVTILLETFDPNPAIGPVEYELRSTNPDLTPSQLPDGLFLDPNTGEIFGFVPYQPAITKEFTFTLDAVKYDKEDLTEAQVIVVVADDAVVGQNFLKVFPLNQEDVNLLIGDTIRIGPSIYTIDSYTSETILGGQLAQLKLKENLLTNVLDGLEIKKSYFIPVSVEFSTQRSSKTFTIAVLGEVDSVIRFITDSNLGDIRPSYTSILQVEAVTSVPNSILKYTIVDGQLPAGLTLSETGNILGKVNQFRDSSVSGFTLFDSNTTTFDGNTSTLDRVYRFVVNAQDQYRFSAVNKEFFLRVGTDDLTLYSNIYTKPFPKKEKRDLFFNFINNTTIFSPEKIYRLGDPEYGIQTDLKMLIYAGIESKEIENYVGAIAQNTKRKRFRLGDVKKAVAKFQGTNTVLYEVIYLDVFDDYENAQGTAASRIKLPNRSNSPVRINQAKRDPVSGKLGTYSNGATSYESLEIENRMNQQAYDRFSPVNTPITIDSKSLHISGNDIEYVYPTSVKNIRKNISEVGITENDFLPLWMVTPQDNRTAATGFVKAIPLCYCKPGEGTFILENIQNSQFDFKQIDFEIDRFIIDSDINSVQETYLKFANHKFNV